MCGIAGIIDSQDRQPDISIIKKMCDTMVHRGPDDEGVYTFSGSHTSVAIGHRRLSIIDLSTGHQPVSNEDGTIWVALNGEIYNFKALRQELEAKGHVFKTNSDTETIVHLYEENDDSFVEKLRGMFAFALWDQKNERLLLVRDRVGKKPLIWTQVVGRLVFASEFSAILSVPFVNKEPDYAAINHYLSYLCVPAPLSAFKGINKLEPAHILKYENGKVSLRRYWQPDFSHKLKITEEDAAVKVKELLTESVKMRLVSDVPLGALLSGGVDSSVIVAIMAQLRGSNIRTFSIGFKESSFNELPHARRIALRFATKHSEYIVEPKAVDIIEQLVTHFGEPFADSSAIPTYYVSKMARQEVTVALNGDGGDEVFGGYNRHLAVRVAEKMNRLPIAFLGSMFPKAIAQKSRLGSVKRFLDASNLSRADRYYRWIGFFTDDFKNRIYADNMKKDVNAESSSRWLEDLFTQPRGLEAVDAALYADTMFYLPNDLLVKMDIAAMANSLEGRSPFLDHKLMEFVARLPAGMKVKCLTLKYILKKSMRGMLPAENLNRQKQGFAVPIGSWFRKDMKDFLASNLLSERSLKRGIFKPCQIKDMVNAHLTARADFAHQLWILLMLELWHQQFID